jgi:hypothetical protein
MPRPRNHWAESTICTAYIRRQYIRGTGRGSHTLGVISSSVEILWDFLSILTTAKEPCCRLDADDHAGFT